MKRCATRGSTRWVLMPCTFGGSGPASRRLGRSWLRRKESWERGSRGPGELIEESSRKFRDDEVRRVEVMLESGRVAINLAREANQTALVTADRAEQEFNKSVGRIAEEMSRALLAESQKWLVLKQTERNRRDAWRLAGCVAAAAVAVFIGGGATTQWWSAKESATRQAVLEAVDRCWVEPRMVRTADGKTVEMCRLADLTTNRPN